MSTAEFSIHCLISALQQTSGSVDETSGSIQPRIALGLTENFHASPQHCQCSYCLTYFDSPEVTIRDPTLPKASFPPSPRTPCHHSLASESVSNSIYPVPRSLSRQQSAGTSVTSSFRTHTSIPPQMAAAPLSSRIPVLVVALGDAAEIVETLLAASTMSSIFRVVVWTAVTFQPIALQLGFCLLGSLTGAVGSRYPSEPAENADEADVSGPQSVRVPFSPSPYPRRHGTSALTPPPPPNSPSPSIRHRSEVGCPEAHVEIISDPLSSMSIASESSSSASLRTSRAKSLKSAAELSSAMASMRTVVASLFTEVDDARLRVVFLSSDPREWPTPCIPSHVLPSATRQEVQCLTSDSVAIHMPAPAALILSPSAILLGAGDPAVVRHCVVIGVSCSFPNGHALLRSSERRQARRRSARRLTSSSYLPYDTAVRAGVGLAASKPPYSSVFSVPSWLRPHPSRVAVVGLPCSGGSTRYNPPVQPLQIFPQHRNILLGPSSASLLPRAEEVSSWTTLLEAYICNSSPEYRDRQLAPVASKFYIAGPQPSGMQNAVSLEIDISAKRSIAMKGGITEIRDNCFDDGGLTASRGCLLESVMERSHILMSTFSVLRKYGKSSSLASGIASDVAVNLAEHAAECDVGYDCSCLVLCFPEVVSTCDATFVGESIADTLSKFYGDLKPAGEPPDTIYALFGSQDGAVTFYDSFMYRHKFLSSSDTCVTPSIYALALCDYVTACPLCLDLCPTSVSGDRGLPFRSLNFFHIFGVIFLMNVLRKSHHRVTMCCLDRYFSLWQFLSLRFGVPLLKFSILSDTAHSSRAGHPGTCSVPPSFDDRSISPARTFDSNAPSSFYGSESALSMNVPDNGMISAQFSSAHVANSLTPNTQLFALSNALSLCSSSIGNAEDDFLSLFGMLRILPFASNPPSAMSLKSTPPNGLTSHPGNFALASVAIELEVLIPDWLECAFMCPSVCLLSAGHQDRWITVRLCDAELMVTAFSSCSDLSSSLSKVEAIIALRKLSECPSLQDMLALRASSPRKTGRSEKAMFLGDFLCCCSTSCMENSAAVLSVSGLSRQACETALALIYTSDPLLCSECASKSCLQKPCDGDLLSCCSGPGWKWITPIQPRISSDNDQQYPDQWQYSLSPGCHWENSPCRDALWRRRRWYRLRELVFLDDALPTKSSMDSRLRSMPVEFNQHATMPGRARSVVSFAEQELDNDRKSPAISAATATVVDDTRSVATSRQPFKVKVPSKWDVAPELLPKPEYPPIERLQEVFRRLSSVRPTHSVASVGSVNHFPTRPLPNPEVAAAPAGSFPTKIFVPPLDWWDRMVSDIAQKRKPYGGTLPLSVVASDKNVPTTAAAPIEASVNDAAPLTSTYVGNSVILEPPKTPDHHTSLPDPNSIAEPEETAQPNTRLNSSASSSSTSSFLSSKQPDVDTSGTSSVAHTPQSYAKAGSVANASTPAGVSPSKVAKVAQDLSSMGDMLAAVKPLLLGELFVLVTAPFKCSLADGHYGKNFVVVWVDEQSETLCWAPSTIAVGLAEHTRCCRPDDPRRCWRLPLANVAVRGTTRVDPWTGRPRFRLSVRSQGRIVEFETEVEDKARRWMIGLVLLGQSSKAPTL